MYSAFIIYIRSLGFYSLLTLPALVLPPMYFISLYYVLTYGWFAWALFTILCLLAEKVKDGSARRILLGGSVLISVLFAFQMIEVGGSEINIWQSGLFLLFPCAAVLAGWISVFLSERKLKKLQHEKEKFIFHPGEGAEL